jgi:RHS repeat-associated protein
MRADETPSTTLIFAPEFLKQLEECVKSPVTVDDFVAANSSNFYRLQQVPTDALTGSDLRGESTSTALSLNSGSSTTYIYDELDNLLSVSQGTQSRTYTYDKLSRLTSYTTPETGPSGSSSGTTNIAYNNPDGTLCAGDPSEPCQVTDPLGVVTTFTYDRLNRLTTESYSDGKTPTVTYCYDGNNSTCLSGFTSTNGAGRRTAMKDGSGATGWAYNIAGDVTTKQRTTNNVTQTFTYVPNLDGSVSSITYPSNRTISYSYSNAQRPISAIDSLNGFPYATGAKYAPTGALSSVLHGASGGFQGISETYTYNSRMQLTGILDSSNVGTILNLSYSLAQASGNNGNIASITNNLDNTRTQTFAYDALNRLASAQSQATSGTNCWGVSLGLDTLGNLASLTPTKCSGGGNLSASINAKNRITNSGFLYDADGRMTSDGAHAYAYDAEDRLTTAGGVTYSYDGNGLRVMKSSGTIDWRGAGGSTLVETDLTGTLQNEYIFFGGARIARRDSSGNVFFNFTDHLGNVRAVASAAGIVCYQADFTPYGSELTPAGFTNSCTPNYRFTGYEYDSETQNYYAVARIYNPSLGRFLSTDPIEGSAGDSQSWNKYAYVGNNPANLTDPAGMDGGGWNPLIVSIRFWHHQGPRHLGVGGTGVAISSDFTIKRVELLRPLQITQAAS